VNKCPSCHRGLPIGAVYCAFCGMEIATGRIPLRGPPPSESAHSAPAPAVAPPSNPNASSQASPAHAGPTAPTQPELVANQQPCKWCGYRGVEYYSNGIAKCPGCDRTYQWR